MPVDRQALLIFLREQLPQYALGLIDTFDAEHLERALRRARQPEAVMTPADMRRVKATSIGFARTFIDRMYRERWNIARRHCEIDGSGEGLVVYSVDALDATFTFGVYSPPLSNIEFAGRARDNAVDFYGAVFDGSVTLERIREEIPELLLLWRGRTNNTSLGWTFANRSNRFFDHTVSALAAGSQPDVTFLARGGGYLLRNAGYFGNGRQGSRSWAALGSDHPLSYPFHAEMLGLYLWRQVGFDYVEAIARCRSTHAVALSSEIKRYLGVGNQSGMGTVAALVRWPNWLSGFCYSREFALALALSVDKGEARKAHQRLSSLLARAARYYREIDTEINPAIEDRALIASELSQLQESFEISVLNGQASIGEFYDLASRSITRETMEQLSSLIIDAFPVICGAMKDVVASAMRLTRDIDPRMSVRELLVRLERSYDWALSIDLSKSEERRYFWYRSEENGENRRGERDVDPGVEYETFVDVVGAVNRLHQNLRECPEPDWPIGRYLIGHPTDAFAVTRIQSLSYLPYSEIRANLIASAFNPADLIRFYLSILGMETTHPTSQQWVRGVFMQGAPLPEDILAEAHTNWALPVLPVECGESVQGLLSDV